MDGKQIFLCMVLVLAVFSLSKIRFLNEYIGPDDELEMYTSVANRGDSDDIDDVRVTVYFPDLGEIFRANTFDIDDNNAYGKHMWWNLGSVPKGDYLVRISASNDNHRDTKFRYITVE